MSSSPDKPKGRKITIFDTTLRDGEQTPHAIMTTAGKLKIAQALQELNVDVIEAGFPGASPDDWAAVREIANTVRGPIICALALCNADDIGRARTALENAIKEDRARIHVFLGTSNIHLEKLGMTPEQAIVAIQDGVARAVKTFTDAGVTPNVEFSPEDATRTDPKFLEKVVELAIDAGATTVNIPDTVGYAYPAEMYQIIANLRKNVPNIDKADISVHCHNDLGMAVANSLAAVEAGANQIECTINGLGERAGMGATDAIVMALNVRNDHYNAYTEVETEKLVPTSNEVEEHSGIKKSFLQPVSGRNAFAHESGIHQAGLLKNPATYQIMKPEDVGCDGSEIILGKLSGINAVFDRFSKYGLPWRRQDRDSFRIRFKKLADSMAANKKYMTDEELLEEVYFPTVEEVIAKENGGPIVSYWERNKPSGECETVTIFTRRGEVTGRASNPEEGVIDALVQGLNIVLPGTDIAEGGLRVESIGEGSDVKARATVTLKRKQVTVTKTVEDSNTSKAEHDAVIEAFNCLYAIYEYQQMVDGEQENDDT